MSNLVKILLVLGVLFAIANLVNLALSQEAVIVGPTSASAGYPIVFETTGSSGSLYEWGVIPPAAARGMLPIDNGRRLVFSVPFEGPLVLTLSVDRKAAANHFLTLTEGVTPPDPPPPLPVPIDLFEHVRRRTAEVKAKVSEFPEVSQVFFVLSQRIDKDELRGSKAIDDATVEALFGKTGDQRENWQSWYESVSKYLLHDLNLMGQTEWASAYVVISEAVSR